MKKFYALLFISSLLSVSQAAIKTTKHTIKKGETLYTIAHANHTTITEVRKANGMKKGETLKLGRVLVVPKNTYFPNKKINKKTIVKKTKHTIKNGETLYIIARVNKTTIGAIRKANGLKKGDNLKIGRVLTVPKNTYLSNKKVVKKSTKKKPTQKIVKHSIKKGETLYIIARKHHTTIREVRKLNGLKKGANLKIGKVLKVPTNTYNAPKSKLAKKTPVKKKNVKIVKHTKKSNKKLVASLSKLETISLEKMTVSKEKTSTSFSFSNLFFSDAIPTTGKSVEITSEAKKKLGRKYVWGATGTKNTFDCSGFTKYVYKKNGINIPRTSINQSKHGKYVSRNDLKRGDLVFFDTSKKRKGYVNHVGIYLGEGKFIHASSAKKKVVVSSLSKFYGQRYKGARRPS